MPQLTTYVHPTPPSFLSKLFQGLMGVFGVKRTIARQLAKGDYAKPPPPLPKGLLKIAEVSTLTIRKRKVWVFKPKNDASSKTILFLHGGAYVWNLLIYDWRFITTLLKRSGAAFIVPDYPLAPESDCQGVFAFMDELNDTCLKGLDPKEVSFMGCSAGSGLALSYAMSLREREMKLPSQLILLFPWLDVSMSNPDLQEVDRSDKILSIQGLQTAGALYAGSLDLKDPRVSPIYGDLAGLGQVSVFIGTHDLFVADCRKLKEQAAELNMAFNYYEYPTMFHGWILADKLPEAKAATDQIVGLIEGHGVRS